MKYLDETMFDLFRQEVESHTAILSETLLLLENNLSEKENLPKLLRAAHSIKGAAKVVELDQLVHLAHAMEECFVAAQSDRLKLEIDHVDLLLKGLDLLTQLGRLSQSEMVNWEKDNSEKIDDITNKLRDLAGGKSSESQKGRVAVKTIAPKKAPRSRLGQAIARATQNITIEKTAKEQGEKLKRILSKKIEEKSAQSAHRTDLAFQDRVLRVTAQNLNRLMGLAGESLVDSLWLQPFGENLLSLKKRQNELADQVEKMRDAFTGMELSEQAKNQITLIQNKTNECRQALTKQLSEFEMFMRRHASLSERLYGEVLDIRMRPFADAVKPFPRMVRDLARHLGKKVKLQIIGLMTPVDRDILEKLEAPLTHLIRNAVDHGIGTPEERTEVGKPIEGTIRVEAAHTTGMLSITVSDDGKGMDLEQLRKKVIERKLASEQIVQNLSESELLEFLFLPGFSTAKEVTEISGRGIGLSVVQTTMQEIGGIVRVTNQKGKGMNFHLQVPLTLSVVRSLLVEILKEPYAFPLARIDQALLIPEETIQMVEGRQYFQYEGVNIGIVPANQILNLTQQEVVQKFLPVIVLYDRFNRYGVVVDRFLGEKDLVVQELDPVLGKVPNISSGAFMEDGKPILIIDIDDMIETIDKFLEGGRLTKLHYEEKGEEQKPAKRILVVDDSITVREVECRLLQNHGYLVDTAVNGMDGWNAVRMGKYDLVIADVDMPRMNGIELIKAIKKDPRLNSLPIMIVTYKDRDEDRKLGLEAGANYYLTKSSFDDQTLLNAVVDLIGT